MTEFIDATPAHCAVLAALHADAFDAAAWSEASFERLLASPGVFALLALDPSGPQNVPAGLIMMREAAGEAEVLTLCTEPVRRRRGLARGLLRAAFAVFENPVDRCFVEVAEDNHAARALYEKTGFEAVGRRTGYYETDRGRIDAVIMVLRRANANQLQIA